MGRVRRSALTVQVRVFHRELRSLAGAPSAAPALGASLAAGRLALSRRPRSGFLRRGGSVTSSESTLGSAPSSRSPELSLFLSSSAMASWIAFSSKVFSFLLHRQNPYYVYHILWAEKTNLSSCQ